MAVGDDWTDEEMFKALPEEAYTVKVGLGSSKARFYLKSYREVRKLLREMIHTVVASKTPLIV